MYSLKLLLTQSPAKIAATVTTVLTTLSLAGWSPLTDQENLGLVGIVSALLGLFYVDSLTSSNAKLRSFASDLADLPPPPAPVKAAAAKKAAAKKKAAT